MKNWTKADWKRWRIARRQAEKARTERVEAAVRGVVEDIVDCQVDTAQARLCGRCEARTRRQLVGIVSEIREGLGP